MNTEAVSSADMQNDKQLVVRLPADLMDKLDIHAEELSKQAMGVPVSRAAAVRGILEHFFAGQAKSKKRGRK